MNTMVQQLIKEHKAMREVLVRLTGTDDRVQLGEMARMLPLVVGSQSSDSEKATAAAVQVLLDVPYRDERVGLTGIL